VGRWTCQSHYQTWEPSPIDRTDSVAADSFASATDSAESGAVAETHSVPPLAAMPELAAVPSGPVVVAAADVVAAAGGNFGLVDSIDRISRVLEGTRRW